MKISGSLITMIFVWALAFTNFLGGPYLLFKIIFWISILPYLVTGLILLVVFFKAKNILKTTYKGQSSVNSNGSISHETIHVEATIKE